MALALALFVAGMLYFGRNPSQRVRLIGTIASAAAAIVVGWIAWYAGVLV
jgi:hypothetical protein